MKEENISIISRVCEVQRERYTVLHDNKEFHAKLKGSFYHEDKEYPVVGDYVTVKLNQTGDSIIEEVEDRKSIFIRPDQSGHAAGYVKTMKTQVLVSNFDYVFIVTSLNQNYNLNRVIRYVTITIQGGGIPVVILTKADLCNDKERYIKEIRSISEKLSVLAVSAVTGEGMEQLNQFLKEGKTIALLGSSGVGKSTLVNTISQKNMMKVSSIRESDARGRHTTTHRQLFVLPNGVTIIDTPGLRELGLLNVENAIDETFSDVTDLINQCKFSNCRHQTEPGCAVRKAIEDHELTLDRWNLYCNLHTENVWVKKKIAKPVERELKKMREKQCKENK